MILVLPFCAKDGALAIKNLLWIEELDGHLPFECVLSHDDATPAEFVRDMAAVATRVFQKVHICFYPAPEKKYWPAAPNCAWQNAARYVEHFIKKPWLFLEADAVPIRKGWLQDIADDYHASGKQFAGHIVEGMGHLNGSCVYPPNVALYSVGAFRTEETAWDVVLGSDLHLREGGILSVAHPAHTLFQHCWNISPETGKAWNGHGEPATFKGLGDVLRLVDLSMGIFHRCKDGTLIDWLRRYHKDPSAVMVPMHTSPNTSGTNAERNNEEEQASSPPNQDVRRDDPMVSLTIAEPEDRPEPTVAHPKTEIFIVTYGLPTKRASGLVVSDFDWLAWCLRGIRRHCRWFQGITLAIPNRDAGLLKPLADEHAKSNCGIPLRIKMFQEPPGAGNGFLMHEIVMANADNFVPKGTEYVLHVDADVIFKERVTPDEYIKDGKPVYVWRSYESLAEVRDGQKVVSDCAQWKAPTEAQLGFPATAYTMCRHPSGFPVKFYDVYRRHIESVHGKPFGDYMMEGNGNHPATRMDFTAMGAFAFERMRDDFHWIDISGGNHLAPPDKQRCYWSHGGLNEHIETEIKSFLS